MTTTILFGLTFVLLVYKVYADEKKSQSYLEEIYRLHRMNTELEGELWQNRIDLQTATNQLKEATCETGLKTRVPPFITIGEMIRINTTDGSYASRA